MGLGSQEPGPPAEPPGSPKPDRSDSWKRSSYASISTASDGHGACVRVGGWDCLPDEPVGIREIGLVPGLVQACFTGGGANIVAIAEARRAKVGALQAADRGDIAPLMAFDRS